MRKEIDRIQIPHHGSNNNYDFQLMNEAALCQFAFCCQDDRDRMQGTTREKTALQSAISAPPVPPRREGPYPISKP